MTINSNSSKSWGGWREIWFSELLLTLIKMSSFQQKNETCKETGKYKQKEQSIETVPEEVQTLHLWDFIPSSTLSQMLLRESNLHNCTW